MTPRVLTPDDVVAAAVTVEAALRPVAGRDWSVQAGPPPPLETANPTPA
jgi:hypothetical protein